MAFDILKPQVSHVADSLEGKVVLIYGTNNTGKTTVGTQLEKPLVLALEKGLNALDGVPYFPIDDWASFVNVITQLTNRKKLDEIKQAYKTIVVDQLENVGEYAKAYICQQYNVRDVGEGKGGYGLWGQLNTLLCDAINKLTGAGFTVYFIDHEAVNEDGYAYPSGEKRAVKAVVNLCDIVGHVVPNGVDENGNVIPSSVVFAQTEHEFGRTKFSPYMATSLPEFTADAFVQCVKDGIQAKAKAEKFKTVSYEEQAKQNTVEHKSFEELMDEIASLGNDMIAKGMSEDLTRIVEAQLGTDGKVGNLKKGQEQVIELLITQMKEFLESVA